MNKNERKLEWDGCFNIRDLGGLPAADGRQTRRGVVVRADLLGQLTPRGKEQLIDYGLRSIIDLRTVAGMEENPPIQFDGHAGSPRVYNLPLVDNFDDIEDQLEQTDGWREVYALYLNTYPQNYARVLRTIAAEPAGGVAFHCFSGKDRTGLIAALLLELAGVDRDVIAADYALSQEYLWPQYEQMVADAGGEEHVARWYKPLTSPQTMLDTLAALDVEYSGVTAYLLHGGLTAEEIQNLREKLV